jgi:CTD small phosphatase-like protein 2
MDCLGTQEPHSIGISTGLLGDHHHQKSTYDQTSRASQQNGCSSNEASKHNIGISEVHFSWDDSSAAMTNLHPLLPCDYGSLVPTLAPRCSDSETVLSPNWKQNDSQSKAMYHSGEGYPNSDFSIHNDFDSQVFLDRNLFRMSTEQ